MDSQYAEGSGTYRPALEQQRVYQPLGGIVPQMPEAAPTLADQIKRLDSNIDGHHARIESLFAQLAQLAGEVQYLRARTGV